MKRTVWTPEDRQIFSKIADTPYGDVWMGGYLDADDDSARLIRDHLMDEEHTIANRVRSQIELTEILGNPMAEDAIY